jgi:hypothetical protein
MLLLPPRALCLYLTYMCVSRLIFRDTVNLITGCGRDAECLSGGPLHLQHFAEEQRHAVLLTP